MGRTKAARAGNQSSCSGCLSGRLLLGLTLIGITDTAAQRRNRVYEAAPMHPVVPLGGRWELQLQIECHE